MGLINKTCSFSCNKGKVNPFLWSIDKRKALLVLDIQNPVKSGRKSFSKLQFLVEDRDQWTFDDGGGIREGRRVSTTQRILIPEQSESIDRVMI